MQNTELIPHLFRTEYRKIVSVLSKHFGFAQIETAEDITSDTFLTASETWGLKGLPANPAAWLYNVAKNKARNYLQRQHTFESKIADEIKNTAFVSYVPDIDLSPQNINDSQLQMMFAICNPAIPAEAQIGLALRILCGFGIEEIADAFLTNKETINKRLYRAKEKLRDEKITIQLPDEKEIEMRVSVVLRTIYLLFNEGYYSTTQNIKLRKELCIEAMRLCFMLIENTPTNTPAANALLSLMCFHSSRFNARVNASGEQILYAEQDNTLWDSDLIQKGDYFLNCASRGNALTKYHLEAAIAFWHTDRKDTTEKWNNILKLYNQLLQIEYSPVAALNRTFALSKANGKQEAITEAEKLKLNDNVFYYILLGELYTDVDNQKARSNYEKALSLAKVPSEKKVITDKIMHLN